MKNIKDFILEARESEEDKRMLEYLKKLEDLNKFAEKNNNFDIYISVTQKEEFTGEEEEAELENILNSKEYNEQKQAYDKWIKEKQKLEQEYAVEKTKIDLLAGKKTKQLYNAWREEE